MTYRVYKDFLRRLLVVAMHYRDSGFTINHAVSNANDNWYDAPRSLGAHDYDRGKLRFALRFVDGEDGFSLGNGDDVDGLIKQMLKQLESDSPFQDRDLIDSIVRAINLPYARNAIAGQNITRLRDALLIPDEIAALRLGLESETFCSSCGHKFMEGEMSTFYTGGRGRDARGFVCTRCVKPSSIAASDDSTKSIHVELIKGLSNILGKKYNAAELLPKEQPQAAPLDPGIPAFIRERMEPPAFAPPAGRAGRPVAAARQQFAIPRDIQNQWIYEGVPVAGNAAEVAVPAAPHPGERDHYDALMRDLARIARPNPEGEDEQ